MENTRLLERLGTLNQSKYFLETQLDLSQNTMVAEYSGSQRKDQIRDEKQRRTLEEQQNKIEQLRTEIATLRSKGPLRRL